MAPPLPDSLHKRKRRSSSQDTYDPDGDFQHKQPIKKTHRNQRPKQSHSSSWSPEASKPSRAPSVVRLQRERRNMRQVSLVENEQKAQGEIYDSITLNQAARRALPPGWVRDVLRNNVPDSHSSVEHTFKLENARKSHSRASSDLSVAKGTPNIKEGPVQKLLSNGTLGSWRQFTLQEKQQQQQQPPPFPHPLSQFPSPEGNTITPTGQNQGGGTAKLVSNAAVVIRERGRRKNIPHPEVIAGLSTQSNPEPTGSYTGRSRAQALITSKHVRLEDQIRTQKKLQKAILDPQSIPRTSVSKPAGTCRPNFTRDRTSALDQLYPVAPATGNYVHPSDYEHGFSGPASATFDSVPPPYPNAPHVPVSPGRAQTPPNPLSVPEIARAALDTEIELPRNLGKVTSVTSCDITPVVPGLGSSTIASKGTDELEAQQAMLTKSDTPLGQGGRRMALKTSGPLVYYSDSEEGNVSDSHTGLSPVFRLPARDTAYMNSDENVSSTIATSSTPQKVLDETATTSKRPYPNSPFQPSREKDALPEIISLIDSDAESDTEDTIRVTPHKTAGSSSNDANIGIGSGTWPRAPRVEYNEKNIVLAKETAEAVEERDQVGLQWEEFDPNRLVDALKRTLTKFDRKGGE